MRTAPAIVAWLVTISAAAQADTHYVWTNSPSPTAPFTSWETAARVIQDAVDAAGIGDTVLVTNGIYSRGGAVTPGGLLTNRVVVDRPVTVRSVDGPEQTFIVGSWASGSGSGNGDDAVRCVYMSGGVLSGFTLANGHTRTTGDDGKDRSGGGACAPGAILDNCTITGSSAAWYGGGAYLGTLSNCTITGNSATWHGGGTCYATLNRCTITRNSAGFSDEGRGGGAYGSTLVNCTIADNRAIESGGGAYACTLSRCTITGNSAGDHGGGTRGGTLNNCTITGNSAAMGGGAAGGTLSNCSIAENSAVEGGGGAIESTLNNCTIAGNSSAYGGGTAGGTQNNCIVYFNRADQGENYSAGTFSYSSTTPDPGGEGNITNGPLLASASHLCSASPCIAAGNYTNSSGTDIDGEAWLDPPCMGCDQVVPGAVTGSLSVAILAEGTNAVAGFALSFHADIAGRATRSVWSFGGGTTATNQPFTSHSWEEAGEYPVILRGYNETYPAGIAATVAVSIAEHTTRYVNPGNLAPRHPYDSWSDAATNIQDAIDASVAGDTVLVTNGIYDSGATSSDDTAMNRVVVDKPVTVASIHGAEATFIAGQASAVSDGIRCIHLAPGAVLSGFTLTNGHAAILGNYQHSNGGGAYAMGATLNDCRIAGNRAGWAGGGTYGGTLNRCEVSGNSAGEGGGGGTRYGMLNNCTIADNAAPERGGGTYGSTLNHCRISGNSSELGGGAHSGTLNNCTITGNSAYHGGGAYRGTLGNCTIVDNSATVGGGTFYGTLNNCIVYYNTATWGQDYSGGVFICSCTTPDPGGEGNITNAPRFVDRPVRNYRLRGVSPCVDSGLNSAWMSEAVDLDGNPRIFNGTVDMGAYEFTMTTELTIVLQGPYDADAHIMNTTLLDNGSVPAESPYASGLTTVPAAPADTVDWVLLELLTTDDYTAVASRSGFIRGDGRIVNEDGMPGMRLEASPGYYYVVAKHRNHLAATSAQPVAYTNNGAVAYDFTTGPDKYRGGTNACAQLKAGVCGMIAGDANGDGEITEADRTIVLSQVGMAGYLQGDLNLDGVVNRDDSPIGTSFHDLTQFGPGGSMIPSQDGRHFRDCPQMQGRVK